MDEGIEDGQISNQSSLARARQKYKQSDLGKAANKAYRDRHKARLNTDRAYRAKQLREIAKQWLYEFKCANKCAECGDSRPPTLDLHHIDPTTKKSTVSDLVAKGVSLESVKAEVVKCIVLCANCHRMFHWNEKMAQDQDLRF